VSRLLRSAGAALALLLAGLSLAACGYSLAGKASSIPPEIRTVLLVPLENRTPRVQVEQILGGAIADELVRRHRLRLVSAREEADSVLSGAIVGFQVTPVTFDAEGRGLQYEITILAQLSFRRRVPEEVLWASDRYRFRDSYEIDPSQVDFFDRETLVIREVAQKFAETAVTDLLEGF